MANSLLTPKKYSNTLIAFADECKKIIHGSFQYLADDTPITEIDGTAIKKAIDEGDEDKIFEYSEAALVKCYQEIDAALNKLFVPEMHGIINSSQIFALLSIFVTITLKMQNMDILQKDLADSHVRAKTESEAYHGLVLGVLDTIYNMAMPKSNEPMEQDNKIYERVIN